MLVIRPWVFNRYILAFDKRGLVQAPVKCGHGLPGVTGRFAIEESNNRHFRLLRTRRERPRRHRAAEQHDELAPLCMSGKQHSERRRGFGHDRLPVATGSPQALRIRNRE